jgi:hypothetical protein
MILIKKYFIYQIIVSTYYPFRVISIGGYTLPHTSLPGLEASPGVILYKCPK